MNRQKRFRWNIRILISIAFVSIFLLNYGNAAAEQPANHQGQPYAPLEKAESLSQPLRPLLQNPLCFGDHQLFDGTNYTGGCSFYWGTGVFEPIDGDKAESVIIREGWSIRLFKDDNVHGPHVCITANDPDLWDNVYSDGTVAANSASLVQVFSQPDCPPPSQPNLVPVTPGGWTYPIVPSTAQGTTAVSTLYADQNTYLDFAYMNAGNYQTTSSITTCLYYDGSELLCESTSLVAGVMDLNTDWILPDWHPTAGWHTLKIVTDVGNAIVESNEADNEWEMDFYWEGETPFHKILPADSAIVPTNPTLSWSSISGATSYEYCYDTANNGACDSQWISTGLNTSAGLINLSPYIHYFWQVRAVVGHGATYADNNTWWRFITRDSGPAGPFYKTGPANGAVGLSTSLTLSWTSSRRAGWYEYCIDEYNNDVCDGSWAMTTSFNVNRVFSKNTTYYWQVRAYATDGTTYADDGAWFHFTIWNTIPAVFNKVGPADGATRLPTSLNLSWTSSTEVSNYDYCYDKTNDDTCTNWVNAGTATQVSLNALDPGTTYYWQVRAVNAGGSTYAEGSLQDFWSFKTIASPPGAFTKLDPADGATGVLVSPTLSWQPTSPLTEYQYCYDTSDDDACTNWISAGTDTSVDLTGLTPDTTYFWHVRAYHDDSDLTYSDGSLVTFRSFTTLPPPPPLILIPGLGGTRLVNDQGELWLGLEKMVDDACSISNGLRATNPYLDVLQLNSSGTAPLLPTDPHFASVATAGMLDTVQYSVECIANKEGDFLVYQPLIDYFVSQGYRLNENLFLFGYDWRRDIRETASALNTLIDQVRGSGKVDIVAHSMGGLVSRNYILEPSRAAKVEHLVILGTPFLGAPMGFKALYLGDDFGINKRAHENGVPSVMRLLDPERVRRIARNWPGIYEILPSQRFFQFYPQGYIDEDRDINSDGLASGELNYQQTLDLMNVAFNPNLINRAITFHSPAMDGFTSSVGNVKVYLFVGVGKPTPGQFRFWSETRFFDLLEIEHVSLTRWNGDGTVVQHAADLKDEVTNLLGSATVYYVNEGHVGLTSSPDIQRQITRLLGGVTEPVNANVRFSPDGWDLAGDWVEVSSGVELHIFDALGNHLGPVGGDIASEIPGADYIEIGDDRSVFLPAGSPYQIVLEGTGEGDFDLRLSKVEEEAGVQETVLFKDIPVIPGLTASLSTDPSLGYDLEVDEDNDGSVDDELPPTSVLDPVESQDITPPQTQIEIVGDKDPLGLYTGPVTITLSAADETGGTGVMKILYSLDGNPPQEYTQPFVVNASEVRTIYAKAIDHAGNEESPLAQAHLGAVRIFLPGVTR